MGLKNGSVFFTDKEKMESYSLSNQFAEHLEFILVKDKFTVTPSDAYYALSLAIRDRLVRRWLRTQQKYKEEDVKRVYYLSLEFLMGRLLGNALINLNYYDECYNILRENGYSLEDIRDIEREMGLGNGGLGRLAACFLDSMATLELPAFGYGIRYEYGIFEQDMENGWQVEKADNWLSYGNPWEIMRRELEYRVKFYGKSVVVNTNGKKKFDWINTEDMLAVAYDVPIPGYGTETVNNLRLWRSKATSEFSFKDFNMGNYLQAVERKDNSENISKVLYPNDTIDKGKYLRLRQQYFFVSATLQDIIRKYKINHKSLKKFADKTAIQLNDTHPVIAIPELMRILMDTEGMGWEESWELTKNTFSYTNHTVVPEALEEWTVNIMSDLLPRHMEIIYEINHRFLEEARKNYTTDDSVIAELSIIREGPEKKVKMSNLAIVGSHAVNGVAELHTKILKEKLFKHFYNMYPDRFYNVTNGITQRRWLRAANPMLSGLITDKIGSGWIKDLSMLEKIEEHMDDTDFLENWQSAKWFNKDLLRSYIFSEHNIKVNLESMFDVQIKRFHEYKRQLLNVLHVITLYNWIKDNPNKEVVPRTVLFAGKAAPAYYMAKLEIKLINAVAGVINNDKDIGDKLKILFLKNYSVSLAEKIIPASDLSEQISTAGFEASGTGNMKLALNGALTIGTMDGANIELQEEVGPENIFIFGLNAEEVVELKRNGYDPREIYERNEQLRRVIDLISSNYFNPTEPGIFKPIIDGLLNYDYYCLFADYQSYIDTQQKVSRLYSNQSEWAKKSILNSARIGKFSSDRSIKEYSEKIWEVEPMKVDVDI
ncbi:MAG TPA: glycogen/starch/alpha-glucan phosphorylase [Ignavibacteriaceae bacterium]|nr:glycogen/starch/alpha-glucan phosphorylase [Ignavibacteriaceae bacterium]